MAILDLILENIHLILLILAVVLAMFSWTGKALCRYLLLLPIGIGSLCSFVMHAFFPEYTASQVGWGSSAFQYQVAAADLGLGIAGVVGFWRSWDYALAVTLIAIGFLVGTAIVHILEGLFAQDYTTTNVGPTLYVDLLIPLLLALMLCYWEAEVTD